MKRKFNAVDLIIVIFILIVIAGGIFAVRMLGSEKTIETKTIVVELTKQKEYFTKIIKKGEIAYDGVENTRLGEVVDFKIENAKSDGISTLDGTVGRSPFPERYDIMLTIEVPESTDVQVGKQMWIETNTYKCNGYVLQVTDAGKAGAE